MNEIEKKIARDTAKLLTKELQKTKLNRFQVPDMQRGHDSRSKDCEKRITYVDKK